MRMTCSGVDRIEPAKALIYCHRDAGAVANRCDTANCKPGGVANQVGFGDPDVTGPSENGAQLFRQALTVTRDQRHDDLITTLEGQRLYDGAKGTAERRCRVMRRARSVGEFDNLGGRPCLREGVTYALYRLSR